MYNKIRTFHASSRDADSAGFPAWIRNLYRIGKPRPLSPQRVNAVTIPPWYHRRQHHVRRLQRALLPPGGLWRQVSQGGRWRPDDYFLKVHRETVPADGRQAFQHLLAKCVPKRELLFNFVAIHNCNDSGDSPTQCVNHFRN